MKTVLVTGSAGFIGSHLVINLLRSLKDVTIVGIDNMNDYYDVSLKEYRLSMIEKESNLSSNSFYHHFQGDISEKSFVEDIFSHYNFDIVVNMAAQAGVRNSIETPDYYIQDNIIGFYTVLEACRHHSIKHLIYASSSSVYGNNSNIPFRLQDRTDTPLSLYAATKKCNELLAHCYGNLYGLHSSGLRFFTVYGPWGRPDMAYYKFTDQILRGEDILLYNYGECIRDFTYIDDIIAGVMSIILSLFNGGLVYKDTSPSKIYNIGSGCPEKLNTFVHLLIDELIHANLLPLDYNIESHMQLAPMQPGDVQVTFADINEMQEEFGFYPKVRLRRGLRLFVDWYKAYNTLNQN